MIGSEGTGKGILSSTTAEQVVPGLDMPVQKLADRISAVFVPGVMGIAGLTAGGWLLGGAPATAGFGRYASSPVPPAR